MILSAGEFTGVPYLPCWRKPGLVPGPRMCVWRDGILGNRQPLRMSSRFFL